jgi:hypothetical protein
VTEEISVAVLLISRGSFSGAQTIAKCLSKNAGIICLTREDLTAAVNGHGELANRITASIAKAASNYAEFSALRRPFKLLMRLALLEYVRAGNVAYFGYSGHLLLPHIAHVVRVRLLAPIELRVAQHMARDNYTAERAREHIRQVDEERSRWTRFMYGKNLRDPELFDVCINLERFSFSAACSILSQIATQSEFQPTAESLAMVENLYLATHVLVVLVMDPRTTSIEVGAIARDGCVSLEGPYLEEAELATLLEVSRSVPGVREVQYTEGYSSNLDVGFGREEVRI